jgi:hypothetical protein
MLVISPGSFITVLIKRHSIDINTASSGAGKIKVPQTINRSVENINRTR